MPRFHADNREPRRLLGPPCPECGVPMMLMSSEPEEIGRELMTYECSLCDRTIREFGELDDEEGGSVQ